VAESYRNIMAALGCYDGGTDRLATGFTATLARGDGRGLGDVWQDVVFQRSILWMIAKGHLTDVRARQVELADLDLKSVKRSAGDYQPKDLGEAMEAAGAPSVISEILRAQARDRRSILVFVPTVSLAAETAESLNADGLSAAVVHGGTPREERLHLYEQFRRGTLRVIVNCMVLTEGADFPFADCAVIARPTSNQALFIQMVGRVLRPSPVTGKSDALVLIMSGEGGRIATLVDLEPDAVPDVQDGESLAEAFEREEERKETRAPAGSVRFELKHKDLDLFSASSAYQWLRTDAGVQFIPLGGNGLIVLWPCKDQEGLWDVAWVPETKAPWRRLHTCLDLGMAMAWGESEADERAALNTGKKASWRRKPASEAQQRYARTLGRPVEPDMRAGEIGDLISVALASRKVDRAARAAGVTTH
jgi:superfamily II DNA or RNA helicase